MALAYAALVLGTAAHADDESAKIWMNNPAAAFQVGAQAYYAGDTKTAISALEAAAEGGHAMAQWKLGRMYADGDGVEEDDARAFRYFSALANTHADDSPGTPSARFIASAFVSLGEYYQSGIEKIVRPNLGQAREIYAYAASYFGDPEAQFRLAEMYMEGEGGGRDPRQAARWLNLAARKGHLEAQMLLGEMLFLGDAAMPPRPAAGLAWLTVARELSQNADGDVRAECAALHEQYFVLASPDDRKRAFDRAHEWLEAFAPQGREQLEAREDHRSRVERLPHRPAHELERRPEPLSSVSVPAFMPR